MIRDLSAWGGEPLPAYDVAIVGSGPAGMTVAHELAGSGLRVAVLESGGLSPSPHADALREVVSDGIEIRASSRERVLGGASTTWAGLSSPLDPIDMAPRALLRVPGWPIAREELLPYWERAERYRFPALEMFAPGGFDAVRARGDVQPTWSGLEEKVFLAAAEPQDFGAEWRHVFERGGADLWLDATVQRLERGGSPGGVERAVLADRGGVRRTLSARVFVLATGGLENARLLLLSTDRCRAGLGNEYDQVGRYLMNHPKHYYGVLHLVRPVRELPHLFGCMYQGYAGYAGLRLPDARLAERDLLNAYVRFEPLFPWSDNRGVEALVLLVKRSGGLFRRWKQAQRDRVVALRDYSETGDDSELQDQRWAGAEKLALVGLVLLHLPSVARYAWSRLREGRAPLVKSVRLRNFMEMEPHPDNRVTLSDARDANGQPLPHVRHAPTELDKRSLVALHAALAKELERNGLGTLSSRLAAEPRWPVDLDASHHMGTTRMGRDPATSVVDADCRLHGADNVYLAGASVFPTSGCANPTFTLVALAIRLAEHLRARLGAPPAPVPRPARARSAARVPMPAPQPGARRVLVVGAGGRVRTDVLPALLSLPDLFGVDGVWSRSPHEVRAGGVRTVSRPLAQLSADDLAGVDLIHLAVSKAAVPAALARLVRHDVSGIDLLVDTPVLLLKHLHHASRFAAFRRAWVAEDCATLPWIGLVRRVVASGALGDPVELRLDRSAYRYHGYALIKTLLGCPDVLTARKEPAPGGGHVHRVRLVDKGLAFLVGPRDYATGTWRLDGTRGALVDARVPGRDDDEPLVLEMTVEGETCTGFRVGDLFEPLLPGEAELLGPVRAGETVTQRMDDCKRVGLARMLRAIHAGEGGYPLQDGLDDMLVDALCDRFGRYRATPVTSLREPAARAALGVLARLLSRS